MAPRAVESPDMEPAVRAEGLVKRFGSLTAVAGLSFEIRRGECFGFLGPNGAGKTTTMKMMYGASSVTEGSLRVLGLDVRGDLREVKRRLGVVPQEDNLDVDLSVVENLVIFARYFGIRAPEAGARARELLSLFELEGREAARVEELSGGMKRRLITARALIAKPEILILDEPTTGLDPAARHMLWEKLRALRREGVTLLLTTHYMDEAERLCDRLVLIDRGRIVAEGTPRDLAERHIGREVLEIEARPEDASKLAEALGQAGGRVTRLPDTVLWYGDDGEEALRRARATGLAESARLRSPTLEDVFLELTGRRLQE